jgi:hypothetical protein
MHENFRFRFKVKTQLGRRIAKMTGLICLRIGTSDNGMHRKQEVSEKLTKYEVLLKEPFAWSWLFGLSLSTLTFATKYNMDLIFIRGNLPFISSVPSKIINLVSCHSLWTSAVFLLF